MKHIKLYNQFLNEGTLDELKTVFNENIELDPLVDRLNKVKAKVNFSGKNTKPFKPTSSLEIENHRLNKLKAESFKKKFDAPKAPLEPFKRFLTKEEMDTLSKYYPMYSFSNVDDDENIFLGNGFSEKAWYYITEQDLDKLMEMQYSTNEGFNLNTLSAYVKSGNKLYVKVEGMPGIYKVIEVSPEDIHVGKLKVQDVLDTDDSEVITIDHDEIEKTLTEEQFEGTKKTNEGFFDNYFNKKEKAAADNILDFLLNEWGGVSMETICAKFKDTSEKEIREILDELEDVKLVNYEDGTYMPTKMASAVNGITNDKPLKK